MISLKTLKTLRAATLSLVGMGLVVLGACASGPAAASPQAPAQSQAAAQPADPVDDYQLGTGDEIRVNVFGEPQLSGNFVVDGQGVISMSLIGEVPVKGLSLREVQREIETRLRNGYLREPQVSAEMTRGRPFYIRGEVNRPGQFNFSPGLTVLNAITAAGDFTYRADKNNVFIKGATDTAERKINPKDGALVKPGDTIRVRERLF